jgi:hypothetical protein
LTPSHRVVHILYMYFVRPVFWHDILEGWWKSEAYLNVFQNNECLLFWKKAHIIPFYEIQFFLWIGRLEYQKIRLSYWFQNVHLTTFFVEIKYTFLNQYEKTVFRNPIHYSWRKNVSSLRRDNKYFLRTWRSKMKETTQNVWKRFFKTNL